MHARGMAGVLVLCGLGACADPVHDDRVEALGGEDPNVEPGPLHRPGQPCVTCHGNKGPAESEYSVAGTVYTLLRDKQPAADVWVLLGDIKGSVFSITTNQAGNFYVEKSEWDPVYPLQVKINRGTISKQMFTHIGQTGSCADCHLDPPGATSPGHVYLAATASELTGE
jgi:hypothetical protein